MTTATLDALADVDTPPVDLDAPAPDLDAPAPTTGRARRTRTGRASTSSTTRKPRSARTATGPTKPRTPKQPAREQVAATYARAVEGVLTLPVLPLAMLGRHNDVLAADAATLAIHGPNLAAALGATAADVPAVAAVLDRILTAGPYSALIAATVPLLAQLAANHGLVPALPLLGTRSRDEMAEYGRSLADGAMTRAQPAPGQ